jgi:hypothetical protein
MDDAEIMMFLAACGLAGWAVYRTTLAQYHPLFFSWNPGLGFARLSVWLGYLLVAMIVIQFSASDIVTDAVYIIFYLLIGYAAVKWAGQLDPVYRISYRVDALERRNSAAGIYLGGRTLAAALVFSGSLIGEGPGFHVLLSFFFLAWGIVEAMIAMLCASRKWRIADSVKMQADIPKASVIAAWYVSLGLIMHNACAGDFLGWGPSLRDFMIKAFPVAAVYFFAFIFKPAWNETPDPHTPVHSYTTVRAFPLREILLTVLYGSIFLMLRHLP